jgi:glycosyltransferase involved in cell wall biosynthesis
MSTDKQPLVSIVTPAYNEEQYLAECIESVLAQSYTYWDYLIVDNRSTDGTLGIAQKYAAGDSRIRVVSNSTLIPAVANFNCALRQISSESKYCKIVLADDWIFPECLERMVALMERNPSVGIVGAYGLQDDWVLWQGLPYGRNVVSGSEICRQRLLGGPYVFGSQTSVLFRSDLVRSRDPFYNEANLHAADSETCFELLRNSDFGFLHQVLTFSRLREGSMRETSRELNAAAADTLHELVTYGPCYLTEEERARCMKATTSKYYDFLTTSLIQRRGRRFWNFHRGRLKDEGVDFSYLRLAFAMGRRISAKFRLQTRNPYEWGL